MRSTRIETQLSIGTNVRILVEAAGVDSLEAFTRYLALVEVPAPESATAQLAGALERQRISGTHARPSRQRTLRLLDAR
jgi:hypothetical protein